MLGGELWFHFMNVMLLTLVVAPLVLWRYRRAVLAGMQHRLGAPLPVPAPRTTARPPPAFTVAAALAWETRLRRRLFVATLAAVFVPSLLLAAQYLAFNDLPMMPSHLFLYAAVTSSVAVPVYAVLTATPFWRALRLGALTLCGLAAAGVVVSMLQRPFYGKAPTLDQALNFVAFFELAANELWLPALLGAVIGLRRVRGVAPLAFAGLLVFATAPLLGVAVTNWLLGMRWSTGWVLTGPGIDAGLLVLALPVGLLAWWRLKALARSYEAKRFSDAQLLAHSWWLVVVAGYALTMVSVHEGTGPLLQILVASVVAYYLFTVLLGQALRWAQRGPRPPARTLLLLRVFGDTRRTEALFERIASRWQRFGPVTMIAAPDVVAGTVDPGDVLRFAAGNIDASFVTSQDDLTRRLATMDAGPDRDGRFRINEFCCHDDTWQATVVALIERADSVVMDLRGFTAQRHGCEFELKELAARLGAARGVLVVDASTDRALLARLMPAGQAAMPMVEVRRGDGAQADAAFAALLGAAA
ncbi:MAG TPA: hypothetical protein VLD35_17460 [Caldimonas sp.]|nr:hypothetical protein [Caldimonas sp.]